MKKCLLFQIVLILGLTGCVSNHFPDIVFEGNSVIKLSVTNYHDTTLFRYKVTTILPNTCLIKKEEINHDGDYFYSYKTSIPDLIHFYLRKDFQTYLIPNDTISITANLDPQIEKEKAIMIDGIYGNISDYYAEKHNTLGYWDIRVPVINASSKAMPLDKTFALVDSIFESEKKFLSNYRRTHNLPDWFCEIIEMDIDYYKTYIKPAAIDIRRHLLNEEINNPEEYYSFDEMPVYNPDAKLSKFYYDFLDIYFGTKHQNDLIGKSGIDRMLPLFSRSIPDIDKELRGDIRELYLASRLSNLFLSCRKKQELEKVDSLYNETKNLFSNETILKILESEKVAIVKYIESVENALKNSPFTLIDIILEDNK